MSEKKTYKATINMNKRGKRSKRTKKKGKNERENKSVEDERMREE